MEHFVEVTVKIGDTIVDAHQFGPGTELEREAFEMGVQVVASNVLPAVVSTVTQYHDHDTEQESCDCESHFDASWWTNGLPERDDDRFRHAIAGGEDTLAALQRLIDVRKGRS